MMTKPSINRKTGYRLLALIPLAGFMFLILSFTNKKEVLPQVSNLHKTELKTSSIVIQPQEPVKVKKDTIKVKEEDNAGMPPPPPPPPPLKSKAPTSVKSPTDMVTAVSPTKMNVFYLGVDNPVNIAVSGVPSDKIFPSNSNGSIRRLGNSYIVNPKQLGQATITIIAEIDGKKVQTGTMDFRVKRIPDPVVKVAGKKGGTIDKNSLLAQMIVQVDLEGFDFDARFEVTEFAVVAENKGSKNLIIFSKSNKITDEQKSLIKGASAGSFIYFQDIKAIGPDGTIRGLSPIAFTIQE